MPKLDVLGTALQGRSTGSLGGQYRNVNAVSHGGYRQIFDGRTKEASEIQSTFLEWCVDLGGIDQVSEEIRNSTDWTKIKPHAIYWKEADSWWLFNGNLSSMDIRVLRNLAVIDWRCIRLARAIVEANGDVAESVTKDFLRHHHALVEGLSKFEGLKRRLREIDHEMREITSRYSYSIPVPAIPAKGESQ